MISGPGPGGADDREVRSGNKRGQEKGKPLDVIEVRVGDEQVRL